MWKDRLSACRGGGELGAGVGKELGCHTVLVRNGVVWTWPIVVEVVRNGWMVDAFLKLEPTDGKPGY